jgi:hypothetical protein
MHYTTLLTTILSLSLTASVSATAISPRALRKANEFVSENW